MRPFPTTIGELLLVLDEIFPEPNPKPGDSVDKIFHSAGQRSVLKYLQQWRESAAKGPALPTPRGQGRPVRGR